MNRDQSLLSWIGVYILKHLERLQKIVYFMQKPDFQKFIKMYDQ